MATNIFQRAAMSLGRRSFTASRSNRLPSTTSLTTESSVLHKFFDPPHLLHSSPLSESPTSSLVKLAATITRETEKLSAYLKDNGIQEPSFDATSAVAFPKLPEDLRKSREEIIIATKELGDLVTGAEEGLRWLAMDVCICPINLEQKLTDNLKFYDVLSLQAIYHYNIGMSLTLVTIDSRTNFEQQSQFHWVALRLLKRLRKRLD